MTAFRSVLSDIATFPTFGRGSHIVILRNYYHLKQTFLQSFFWMLLEPLSYLLAVGYGLGAIISDVDGRHFIYFFAPGLIVVTAVMNSYYESAYGIGHRLQGRNAFGPMLLSPLRRSDLCTGELIWCTLRGVVSSSILIAVCYSFGIFDNMRILLVLPVVAAISLISVSIGMMALSLRRGNSLLIVIQAGVIIPISMFSETFFPSSIMPEALQGLVYLSPVTHAMVPIRMILDGRLTSDFYLHLIVLFLLVIASVNFASSLLGRRLQKDT